MSRQEKEPQTELKVETLTDGSDIFQDGSADRQTLCGVGSCTPSGVQRCANIAVFTGSAGISSLCLQMLTLYLASQITSLEKQFGLSSTESGVLLSCNEIGFLSLVLIFSHFGRKGHMPRILAVTAVIYGFAGVVCSLPQFIEPAYLPKAGITDTNTSRDGDDYLCSSEESPNDTCKVDQSGELGSSHWAFYLLALSFVVQGAGKSARTPLTTVYIDNNVHDEKRTGLFLGVTNFLSFLAPGLAFFFGGIFSSIPVDFEDTLLTPIDTRWIGAWWLGFLIFGSLSVVVAVPLFFFPKRLKGSWKETQMVQEDRQELTLWQMIKGLPASLMRVVKNPVYTLTLCGSTLVIFSVVGFASFAPKYMETVLLIPAWKTSVILGIQTTLSTGIWSLVGGYLTTRFRLKTRGCLKFILVLMASSICVVSLNVIFGCQHPLINGMQSNRTSANDSNTGCDCNDVKFLPVCGVNTQRTYFSPCHAGCSSQNETIYDDCIVEAGSDVTVGMCDAGCPYLYPYALTSLADSILLSLTIVPGYVILLRSAQEEDKPMAIGILSFVTSLLGYLPAPVVFGKVIDTTCRLWNYTCGTRGSCALYDIVNLRMKMIGIVAAFRVGTTAVFLVAFLVNKYVLKCHTKDLPKQDTTDTKL